MQQARSDRACRRRPAGDGARAGRGNGRQPAGGARSAAARRLPAFGDRRHHGRPGRFQRQQECLDTVDACLQGRAVRAAMAQHAVPRQQGGVPARHQPGDAAHRRRTGRYAGPRAGHVADRQQSAGGPHGAELGRGGLVYRLPRPDTADAQRLSRRDQAAAGVQRRPGAVPHRVRRARRQSAAVHRPHHQRHRVDVRHPASAAGRIERRLVRPTRRRPLLVRLRPALRLLWHPRSGARRLRFGDRRTQPDAGLGGHGGAAAHLAEHAAGDHLQRPGGELPVPVAPGEHGLLRAAGALATGRDQADPRPRAFRSGNETTKQAPPSGICS